MVLLPTRLAALTGIGIVSELPAVRSGSETPLTMTFDAVRVPMFFMVALSSCVEPTGPPKPLEVVRYAISTGSWTPSPTGTFGPSSSTPPLTLLESARVEFTSFPVFGSVVTKP